MELAKKPVKFLCNADAPTLSISVPKTEHHYLFYRDQPYLVKFDLDIEFLDKDLRFDRVDDTPEENVESSDANEKEESPGDATQEETIKSVSEKKESNYEMTDFEMTGKDSAKATFTLKKFSKKELQKMRKSDVRDILKKLDPEKSCPVRKENIIKAVLEAQKPK